MAHITADRVRQTSTSTGTGSIVLSGSIASFRDFSAVLAVNDTFWYAIASYPGSEWEVGLGTYTSASTFTRTTVLSSSNAGAAVTFSAGTKEVFITSAAGKFLQADAAGSYGNFTAGTITAALTGNASTATTLASDTAWMKDRGSVTLANQDTAISNGFYNQTNASDSQGILTFNPGGSLGPLQMTFTYGGLFQFRNKTDSTTWTAWKTVLHSSNYNTYSPTLTGTGASGSWGISVTGSAATLTTSRTLWGQGFTGAANVTGSLTSVGDITGTAGVTLTATAGTLALAATGANSITASTNGSSRLTINSAGNVTLTNDLTVSGTITNVKNKLNTVTANLGNPTVEEMALFHGQFNNKFRFLSAFTQEESTDGVTWTTSTRATANQLADIMLGEGQTGGFNAIPAMAIAGSGYYRLTWDQSQTGYVYLNALYIYCSTQGNNVTFTVERQHNTTGWETVATSTTNVWPGHIYIPHTLIPFSSTSTHYGKVRISFVVTSAATVNPIQLNAVEWFGGYPAGKRNVESYDRLKNVTFPAVVNGTAIQGSQLGVNNTVGSNGYGLSLYGGAQSGKPPYGIMFQQTATFGSYGPVTADWATYFTMNSTASRGWIFKSSDLSDTTGNIASISTAGAAQFASTVTGTQLISNVATGTAPLTVASTTLVSNLNADLFDGRHLDTLSANLRANRSLTGGGTITVDASYNVLWSTRFIIISNGFGAHFSTSGYFDITCPTSGTITGVGGAANVTATAAGIPLTGAWQALYYILPIGSAATSLAANFRVAGYQSALTIPDEWILIAIRNSDTGQGVHFNNGYRLEPGESIDTSLYDAKNADLLDGLNSATANTASTIVARDASGNFSAGTITASLTGNASGSAATFTSTSQNSQFNSIGIGVAASGTAGQINAGNIIASGIVTGTGGIKSSDTSFPTYQILLDFGSDLTGTWRKIITATLQGSPATYSTHGFKISITDPNANHATQASVNVDEVVYYVACVRSEATVVDTPDLCVVRGPAQHVRAVKTATGSYEIQVQPEAQYREYLITIESYATNGAHTIVYSNGSTAGSAGTATYSAAVGSAITWVDKLQSTGTVTGTQLVSNIATGAAPLTVASTTLVTNLNADLLDGLNSATANTASTIVARDASGSFSAGAISLGSTTTIRAQGAEGGEFVLEKGTGQTNLGGNIHIDTLGDVLRIFENGGSTRQFNFNFTNGNISAQNGSITANLTGAASSNVLKAGDTMTGALAVNTAVATPLSISNSTAASLAEFGVNSNDRGIILGVRSSTHPSGALSYLYTGSAQPLAFYTNAAERMRIDSSGNVTPGVTNTQTLGAVGDVWSAVHANTVAAPFFESTQTISTSYTITSGSNAMTPGPITIASGITVTVPSGSVWTIV